MLQVVHGGNDDFAKHEMMKGNMDKIAQIAAARIHHNFAFPQTVSTLITVQSYASTFTY
jgi:hypothetical protein